MVIGGAIIGFALSEGTQSPTWKGDMRIATIFLIFALLFQFNKPDKKLP